MKTIKKHLLSTFCFLPLSCLGVNKAITVNNQDYTAINTYISGVNAGDNIQLTISDPSMEKTWAIFSGLVAKNNLTLELTAKDNVLNKNNLEYLAECLLYASNNINLTKLDISNNGLSAGNNTFFEYLSSCAALDTINISKNKSSFCSLLLDKLSTKALTTFIASECGLKARNFEKILSLNTRITTIDLSKNNIDGLTDKIATYLNKQTSPFTLTLDENAELFKNPKTVQQLLSGINGKTNTVNLRTTNCNTFIQNWLTEKKAGNTITFN